MEKDIEKRLQAMRSRFMENFPQDEDKIEAKVNAFAEMSDQQREEELVDMMQVLDEKKSIFSEKYTLSADSLEKEELKEDIEVLTDKISNIEKKLTLIHSGKIDTTKLEKIKRQLINLELKRCKTLLEGKDCSRIDEKIAEKKALFKEGYNS